MNRIRQRAAMTALILGAWMSPAPVQAAEARVSVEPESVAPGGTASAWVTLENASGTTGADVALRLPDFAVPQPAQAVDLAEGFLLASRARPGRVDLAIASATGLSSDEPVTFRIPFKVSRTAEAGLHPLTFELVQLYDSTPGRVAGHAVPGTLVVTPPPVDLDGDGLPDEWEIAHFGNTEVTGEIDSDQDGIIDSGEFIAGTDPRRAESVFAIAHMEVFIDQGEVVMRWLGGEERAYEIEWSDDSLGPEMTWHSVYNPTIQFDEAGAEWRDDGSLTYQLPPTTIRRFYRIRASLP